MKRNKLNNKVAIIMGSQSDHSIMKECAKILKTLKIKYQISIVSAHRTPKRMFEFAESASKNGFGVIVAGANGSMNAGLLAASIIGNFDEKIKSNLEKWKRLQTKSIKKKP